MRARFVFYAGRATATSDITLGRYPFPQNLCYPSAFFDKETV